MYFSDVYADQEVSEEARKDKVLWGIYSSLIEFATNHQRKCFPGIVDFVKSANLFLFVKCCPNFA